MFQSNFVIRPTMRIPLDFLMETGNPLLYLTGMVVVMVAVASSIVSATFMPPERNGNPLTDRRGFGAFGGAWRRSRSHVKK